MIPTWVHIQKELLLILKSIYWDQQDWLSREPNRNPCDINISSGPDSAQMMSETHVVHKAFTGSHSATRLWSHFPLSMIYYWKTTLVDKHCLLFTVDETIFPSHPNIS